MRKHRRTAFDPETMIVAASAIEERAHTMHTAHTVLGFSNIQTQQRKRRWTGTRTDKRIYLQLLQLAKSMRAEAQDAMQAKLDLDEKEKQ